MYSKEIEERKKHLKLTKRQRAIIVGTLLGDGHLETLNHGRTYRLKIEHSLKQKEYVDWFFNELQEWIPSNPKERTLEKMPPGAKGKRMLSYYGFTTYSHGALRFYAQQFYTKEKKKIIPKRIHKLITPLSMAVWFMDDGSWKSSEHKTFIFHTYGYQKRELIYLMAVLQRKFGIKCSLHKQKGSYWRLYVLSRSAEEFLKIVKPFIVPSMQYKLGNWIT